MESYEEKKEDKKLNKLVRELSEENKKLKDKIKKAKLPGRGVESMFRLTARNQINLSSIADNKANILISINSLILTVLLTVGVSKIADYRQFTAPVVIFLATSLTTTVYAILSTRPKISSGKFRKEDILGQKVNLLFFGNFYKMDKEEYCWAIKEMMKDEDYLYSSLITDQYSLGKVISKKYILLRTAYTIFMFGITLATLVFIFVLFFIPF